MRRNTVALSRKVSGGIYGVLDWSMPPVRSEDNDSDSAPFDPDKAPPDPPETLDLFENQRYQQTDSVGPRSLHAQTRSAAFGLARAYTNAEKGNDNRDNRPFPGHVPNFRFLCRKVDLRENPLLVASLEDHE